MDRERYPRTSFGQARRTPGRHGYVAYFPAPIPRALTFPMSTLALLGDAEASLGRLSGYNRLLPSPSPLLRPYILREALASTRIEGTHATISEVIEVDAAAETPNHDVEEVLNYVDALDWGLGELDRLPVSTRLLRGMHRRLMAGVRGRERTPGELRRSQNSIGGATVQAAEFVPPPPEELPALLADWERFANEQAEMPVLIQNALLHSQFETIHPFLDGNGRLGRLMLVYFLIVRGRLDAPLLYLSDYLEADRQRYYESLRAIQQSGDPSPWIELYLTAVQTQAGDALSRAARIVDLRQRYLEEAAGLGSRNAFALVDLICQSPVVTSRPVEERLGVTRPTALRLLRRLEEKGVLSEGDRGSRGQRHYVAEEMMAAVAGEGTGGD